MKPLRISPNHHFFMTEDSAPFFWLGDTAWCLYHRLRREEIIAYYVNRRDKGFNVVQAVVLVEQDGLHSTNPYGEYALHNDDPTKPNESYFARIDDYLTLAAQHDLYICLLPVWADKITPDWGIGPVVFDEHNALIYGQWLADRYRDYPHIIWCLGGDRPPRKGEADWRPIWRAMAEGIRSVVGTQALITYHPDGGLESPSTIHAESWSDFVTIQSGHWARETPGWEWVEHLYLLNPSKPVLDAESNYEDHPVAPWPSWESSNGYFRDYEVRKQTWRTVFAGGAGLTYGHHSIWQCASQQYETINYAEFSWQAALDRPAARQMIHLRRLIESRPCLERVPDQSLLVSPARGRAEHPCAFRDAKGRYAMVYTPIDQKLILNTARKLNGAHLRCWWYNPRTGAATLIGDHRNSGELSFDPPVDGPDWVLVLDDAAEGYAAPGVT